MKYLFLFVFLCGCGSFSKSHGLYFEGPEFGAYASAYKEYKKLYLGTDAINYAIDMQFEHLESPTVGRCIYSRNKLVTRTIIIDLTYWERSGDEQRLDIIFHELGHCDLDYGHQELVNGIMNAKTRGGRVSDEFIEQFFLEGL